MARKSSRRGSKKYGTNQTKRSYRGSKQTNIRLPPPRCGGNPRQASQSRFRAAEQRYRAYVQNLVEITDTQRIMIITMNPNVRRRFVVDVDTKFASILVTMAQSYNLPELFWLVIDGGSAVLPDHTPRFANLIGEDTFTVHISTSAPTIAHYQNGYQFDLTELERVAQQQLSL